MSNQEKLLIALDYWFTTSKLFNKEEIGKGAYGAVLTADYPFHGIDDKGQEFRVLGASFSRFRGLRFRVLGASFSRFRGLRFRVLSASFSRFWGLRFRDRVLRFRDRGLRFRVLGASFSSFGCFVFEIWVLRASVFVFECFVFETTINFIHVDRSLGCTQTVNGLDPIQHQLKPLYNSE